MGLRVTTNLAALTAARHLATSDAAAGRSLERLSSGFRINRAADDAAGLAISEGLRSQVRGMTTALRNSRDGVSVVQTAEGALDRTTAVLQRMRDLAVQAANTGGLDEAARADVQREVVQLKAEFTRIAESTRFNGTPLLDGTYQGTFQVGAAVGETLTLVLGTELGTTGLGLAGLDVRRTVDPAGAVYPARGPVTLTTPDRGRVVFVGAADPAGIAGLRGTISVDGASFDLSTVDYTGAGTVPEMVDVLNAAVAAAPGFDYDTELFKYDAEDLIFRGPVPTGGATDMEAISPAYAPAGGEGTRYRFLARTEIPASPGGISFPGTDRDDIPSLRGVVSVGDRSLDLGTVDYTDGAGGTVGGDQALARLNAAAAAAGLDGSFTDSPATYLGDDVFEQVPSMLRFTGPVPTTPAEIDAASPSFGHLPDPITAIDAAISAVSTQRAELGAFQNRLEHTIARLGVSIENTAAAESRIRDTDMAAETTRFTRAQILGQAGTAMLAQANQSTQGILALLQA